MPTEQCNRVLVERYFLGEAGVEEKRTFRAHMDGCADCRGRLATLENEKREYLIAHPFREFAARRLDGKLPPEGKAAPKSAFGFRWMPALAGLAACLVLVPVVLHYNQAETLTSESGIRTKGGTILEYYVKHGETVSPGSTSEAYRSGDELQFVYSAGGHAFVTLASVDSRGHVSLYRASRDGAQPEEGAPLSLAATSGDKQTLPFGVTLDDSPGSEFFVMIYGAQPLAGAAVESWLKEAYTRASGNLEGLGSLLSPPPGPKSEIKVLLLRKSQT